MSVRVFPEDISIWIGGLSKADDPSQYEWTSSSLPRDQTEHKGERANSVSAWVETFIYSRPQNSALLVSRLSDSVQDTHHQPPISRPLDHWFFWLSILQMADHESSWMWATPWESKAVNSQGGCSCKPMQMTFRGSITMWASSYDKFPLICLYLYTCVHDQLLQSCPTLCDLMDCSPQGSFVCGILEARILEWVPMPSSRRLFQPRDWTDVSCISCIAGGVFTAATLGKPPISMYLYLYLLLVLFLWRAMSNTLSLPLGLVHRGSWITHI